MNKVMKHTYVTGSCILIMAAVGTSIMLSASVDQIDVEVLGIYLDVLMNETLGVEEMQKRIDILDFRRERYNGASLVRELSEKISKNISQHIEGLRKTTAILQDEIDSRKNKMSSKSIWTSCCQYPDQKIVFDIGFKTKVNLDDICELVSDTTPLEYFQLPKSVLMQMKKNHEDMPFLKWQYVGSNQGVFFSYPAHRRPNLCMGSHYDPRYRPWYVEAASPEEKHVVILLDSSNSMARTHNSMRLLDIAIEAIGTLLDSFTPTDKVGIAAFNDTAFYPDDCFSKQLGYVDTINKKKLKEQFLSRLQPGGQSQYSKAFQAAFQLFEATSSILKSEEVRLTKRSSRCVILFISDGDATEIQHHRTHEIFRIIREGNLKISNSVDIFSYGLGRNTNITLLDKISKQDFDDVLGDVNDTMTAPHRSAVPIGRAYKIEEPSQLRNELSFFYANLVNNMTSSEESEPSFSVPYVDEGGLGIIFTAGFPVYVNVNDVKRLAAVAAIDISIADLLGDAIKLKNDDRSYVFVIDGSGRVLIHPLLPLPGASDNAPPFIHIEALERDTLLKDVIESMIQGNHGNKSILSSRVAPAGDGNKVFMVNQTYHWHPIANTNFSLCFVEEETDYMVHLAPNISIYGCIGESGDQVVANQCPGMTAGTFRYHRLDLTSSSDVCRHFYQISTIRSSVVKLAPQCFENSAFYEQNAETSDQVKAYESRFNELLRASSSREADNLLQNEKNREIVFDIIQDDVISDILWTASADDLWLTTPQNHVIRRYIGTRTGMVRFYPGTNISSSYDPVKRDWYELALAHPGMRVFSPPYKDAAGAGNVITISHTVHTLKLPPEEEVSSVSAEKVIGVMGLDLSLTSFYSKMLDLYPRCSKEWHCIIMDNRGFFILHESYTEAEAPQRKHITGEEGPLAQILLQRGLMHHARCLDLQTTKYRVSYVLQNEAKINELNDRDECKRYYMEPIPNSNVFFVGREYHEPCFYKTCVINNNPCHAHTRCANHDDWSNTTCECPCSTDLVINNCNSFIEAQLNIVPCYPARNSESSVLNECLPESLAPCYDMHCENKTSNLNCSGVVGCTWCRKSTTGSMLEDPYCARTDVCYDGFEGHRLPGFADQEVATIAAAIGARETRTRRTGNYSQGNDSAGRREHRRSSASSASSNRQRSVTSPQVVLSIVDSEGEEIARSLPRPVQIVRGNKAEATKDLKNVTGIEGRQIRANSTPSIVLGSAGESSGLSSTGDVKNESTPDTTHSVANHSTQNSPKSSIRKRNHSSSAGTSKSDKSTKTEEQTGSNVDSQNLNETYSDDRSQFKPKIANVLRSVLRKRVPSKQSETADSTGTEIPQDLVPGTSYYNMFAEPASNEGDIPIIQSDHSDSENISDSGASEYVSVCNGSGRVSSSSWVTSSRRRSELWQNIDDEEEVLGVVVNQKPEDVFYDDEMHEDTIEEVCQRDASVASYDSPKAKRTNSSVEQLSSRLDSDETISEEAADNETSIQRKMPDNKNKSKNKKTHNFIVYV